MGYGGFGKARVGSGWSLGGPGLSSGGLEIEFGWAGFGFGSG